MKRNRITATGKIDKNGRLAMYMGELNDFFARNKGARVFASFVAVAPGCSEALKGYYYHCVVPAFQQGLRESGERLTEAQTEHRMRELSPVAYEEMPDLSTGKYNTRLRSITELSNAELIDHIDHLKQVAAEEFGIYIEEPKIICYETEDYCNRRHGQRVREDGR